MLCSNNGKNNIINRIAHKYIHSKIILRAGQKRNVKANHNRKKCTQYIFDDLKKGNKHIVL